VLITGTGATIGVDGEYKLKRSSIFYTLGYSTTSEIGVIVAIGCTS
jgi:hypothetical protein